MKLLQAIINRFPDGLEYLDAVRLCVWIHLTKNNFPSAQGDFAGEKKELAQAFAAFSCSGGVRCVGSITIHKIGNVEFWISVIESAYLDGYAPDCDIPSKFRDIFPYDQVTDETSPAGSRRSASRQPPEGPPPAKQGSAPR